MLFVWGPGRIVPVRVTALTITEKLYDGLLNPTRAEVQITLRVLTDDELKHDTDTLAGLARAANSYTPGAAPGARRRQPRQLGRVDPRHAPDLRAAPCSIPTAATPSAGTYQVTLPDGTVVTVTRIPRPSAQRRHRLVPRAARPSGST